MRRVAVIGCGGSGKTTLARELGRLLDLPVLHIDRVYWRGDDELPSADWPGVHRDLISGDRWIIDGVKPGVLGECLERADSVIFLDLPTRACLWGVLRRRLEFRGRLDADLGVFDSISWPFVRWIWGFRRRQRPRILALLDECSCDVVVLESRRKARRFIAGFSSDPSEASVVGSTVAVGTHS